MLDSALKMTKDNNEKMKSPIPVAALFDSKDRDLLLSFRDKFPDSRFFIYDPDSRQHGLKFYISYSVIILMAVVTIMLGSFRSGALQHQIWRSSTMLSGTL